MTYEEAFEICELAIKLFCLKQYETQSELIDDLCKRTDIVIMEKAIDKQIAKEVQGELSRDMTTIIGYCPSCRALNNSSADYYPLCGQHLKWSSKDVSNH